MPCPALKSVLQLLLLLGYEPKSQEAQGRRQVQASRQALKEALDAMLRKDTVQWAPAYASALIAQHDPLSANVCLTLAQLDGSTTSTHKCASANRDWVVHQLIRAACRYEAFRCRQAQFFSPLRLA